MFLLAVRSTGCAFYASCTNTEWELYSGAYIRRYVCCLFVHLVELEKLPSEYMLSFCSPSRAGEASQEAHKSFTLHSFFCFFLLGIM